MLKLTRLFVLAAIAYISPVALDGLGNDTAGLTSVAHAQGIPGGLSKLEEKANDLQTLIQRILFVFTGIGIAFCGFRFITGDPHAWKYTLTVIVGATIVFTAGELMQWLQR